MNKIFDYLKSLYNEHGYRLYMIGSTSRDYLLNREIEDYDFVTDALPNESLKFIKASGTFEKYGVLNLKIEGKNIDIVTLRKENGYKDSRHPSKIEFIKDINIDYLRRDLTINAIYINENYEVEKVSLSGKEDLLNKKLTFIGDALARIQEDPLRILRAFRFMKEYDLSISEDDLKILKENVHLLEKLNPQKVKDEYKKMQKVEEIINEHKYKSI